MSRGKHTFLNTKRLHDKQFHFVFSSIVFSLSRLKYGGKLRFYRCASVKKVPLSLVAALTDECVKHKGYNDFHNTIFR